MIGPMELVLLLVLLVLPYSILWVIAFVDILRSEFRDNEKLIWVLAVIFAPVLGMLCYFLFGRKRKAAKRGVSGIDG